MCIIVLFFVSEAKISKGFDLLKKTSIKYIYDVIDKTYERIVLAVFRSI